METVLIVDSRFIKMGTSFHLRLMKSCRIKSKLLSHYCTPKNALKIPTNLAHRAPLKYGEQFKILLGQLSVTLITLLRKL